MLKHPLELKKYISGSKPESGKDNGKCYLSNNAQTCYTLITAVTHDNMTTENQMNQVKSLRTESQTEDG